jgi:hypothetical protein
MQPLSPPSRLAWLGQPNSRNKLAGVDAPASILDAGSRALLSDFDHQIAGSGGIASIKAQTMGSGNLRVTISGTAHPGRISRSGSGGAPIAPSFNDSPKLIKAGEVGLPHQDWQRAHLWGPGFGDEAAAGLWYARTEVNNILQNGITEGFVRDLATQAEAAGGSVSVTVSGERYSPDEVPAAHRGGEFLKEIQYQVTVRDAGGNEVSSHRMEFGLTPPPDGRFQNWEADETSRRYLDPLMSDRAAAADERR